MGGLPHPQDDLTRRLLPTTGFQLIRQEERSLVVTSPFRIGEQPNIRYGIATISDAKDAIDVHQRLADQLWSSVIQGNAAADELHRLVRLARRTVVDQSSLRRVLPGRALLEE